VKFAEFGQLIFADTVGFIRHLPHDLVAAFKSTLQESREADLQLHVIDVSDARMADNIAQVQHVLHEIDADELLQLKVFNKIDAAEQQPRIEYNDEGLPIAVYISARDGIGLELLNQAIIRLLSDSFMQVRLSLPPSEGQWRARFHEAGCIQQESFDEQGHSLLRIALPRAQWDKLLKLSDGVLNRYIIEL
jgi:GTP-binding protein HflX